MKKLVLIILVLLLLAGGGGGYYYFFVMKNEASEEMDQGSPDEAMDEVIETGDGNLTKAPAVKKKCGLLCHFCSFKCPGPIRIRHRIFGLCCKRVLRSRLTKSKVTGYA